MNAPRIPGKSGCQCTACGAIFGSERGFAAHRVGKFPDRRRCLAPAACGLALNERGVWVRRGPHQHSAIADGVDPGAEEGAQ